MVRVLSALLLVFAAACRAPAPPRQLDETVLGEYLPFVEDGRTTREAVLLELGAPAASFEEDRIQTWRLVLRDGEVAVLARAESRWDQRVSTYSWPRTCSLVLVFDERGVLARHSLVAVRSEW